VPPVAPALIDCYSEWLPTAGYLGPMHFRLTARDGQPDAGGVASADTTVNLALGTGPFLVTAPAGGAVWEPGGTATVSWNVAGTDGGAINADDVRITLSDDGGQTFAHVLEASTPNDGTAAVDVPPGLDTDEARVRVEAVGNVFFDVSGADFVVGDAPPPPLPELQTIEFPQPADRTYGDPPFTVSAAASSGLPVSFEAAGDCAVAGREVTLTGAGSCTLTARQTGNAMYAPAVDIERTFAVARASTSTALTLTPRKAKRKKRVRATARVVSDGLAPTGAVMFTQGSKTLGEAAVGGGGQASIRFRARKSGAVLARYAQSDDFAASAGSAKLKIKKRRR
jgi:predicted outer membrane repeat protein